MEQVSDQSHRECEGSNFPNDWYGKALAAFYTLSLSSQCVEVIFSTKNFYPGKNDLRVPPSQGYEFYHSLKVTFQIDLYLTNNGLVIQALGKTVEMNVYDDNHPLGKVENDVNVMINAALFYHKHLNM